MDSAPKNPDDHAPEAAPEDASAPQNAPAPQEARPRRGRLILASELRPPPEWMRHPPKPEDKEPGLFK